MEHPNFKSTLKQVREMDITGQPLVKKIHVAREKLDLIQRHIQDYLTDQEKMLILEIEKWNRVEEQVLRQKSRATWIECGDANSKYFHAQWKFRCSHNAINSIYIANNTKLIDPREIEAKFIGVFTGLMGASTSNLPCLNVEVVNTGVCLTLQQQKDMIKEVTQEEIIEAIKNMPKQKAPGVDGFPIEFFTGTGI
ncbi:hypothetical protein KY289_008505 [Solanum tuberosum]|nr:hypothetical protein KY289_008505 [Solanum tuberosum]